jgi:hypothetical protein
MNESPTDIHQSGNQSIHRSSLDSIDHSIHHPSPIIDPRCVNHIRSIDSAITNQSIHQLFSESIDPSLHESFYQIQQSPLNSAHSTSQKNTPIPPSFAQKTADTHAYFKRSKSSIFAPLMHPHGKSS